jgi:uncharacterized protein
LIRRILKALGIGVLVYLLLCVGFYLWQDKILFQPQSLTPDYSFSFAQPVKEYFIPTEDGNRLHALFFHSSQPSRGLVLYFHGNADNLQRWGEYAIDFTNIGYDVLMLEYRGYGKSSGIPGKENFYSDAEWVQAWAQKNIPYSRLIIYGRSMGSAVASHLASVVTPDLLILETPFDEIKTVHPLIRIFSLFPPRNNFSNKENISKVTCRKVLIHGTSDWIVPLSSALRLKPLLTETDLFVVIEGGGHKNLRDFDLYHQTLIQALTE